MRRKFTRKESIIPLAFPMGVPIICGIINSPNSKNFEHLNLFLRDIHKGTRIYSWLPKIFAFDFREFLGVYFKTILSSNFLLFFIPYFASVPLLYTFIQLDNILTCTHIRINPVLFGAFLLRTLLKAIALIGGDILSRPFLLSENDSA